jgi:uncharacterized protein YjbI with pentapeptide repeats
MSDNVDKIFAGRLTQDELDKMFKAHGDFLIGLNGGKRLLLQFMNLSGLNFSGQNLTKAVFTGSALIQANMSMAVLDKANFFGCDLRYANLEGASLIKADMRGVCARGARLNNADMFQADLRVGQVLTHERTGELKSLYFDIPEPSGNGLTDFSQATMRRARLTEIQAGYADFSEAEMSGVRMIKANMRGANMSGANLERSDMTGADMSNANFRDAVMMDSVMTHSKTDGADFKGALQESFNKNLSDLGQSLDELIESHRHWVETSGKEGRYLDLSGYDLRKASALQGAKMTAVKAQGTLFIGMNLNGIELQHGFLNDADFRSCMLIGADFRGSNLRNGKFSRADLRRANFQPLLMGNGTTKNVDLTDASFKYADLREADFKYANLTNVDFSFARLDGADFTGADVTGMVMENVDTTHIRGLELPSSTVET